MISRHKLKKSEVKDNEYRKEKNQKENSKKDLLDEENKLVERKLESDKARKRTRGPYRKSLVN
ncbi:MAG TPA: hypothetical protein VE594_03330 [Nitrososphaeraceae archaeon]|nr:hypothetical protein [Nitrososphaeraceae archaeon]